MDFKVSINEIVKVKLTDFGIQILKDRHNELDATIKARGGNGLGDFTLRVDDEGYSKFQLWSLMNTFGDYVGLGLEAPFELGIIITKGEAID